MGSPFFFRLFPLLFSLRILKLFLLSGEISLSSMPLHIVVVDDEPEIVSLVSETLEMDDFIVTSFTCPMQALNSLGDLEFNVIISDAHMPGMTGMEFLAKTKESIERPFFFFLCTGDMSIDTEKFESLGGTKIISKPFSIIELGETIRSTCL